MIRIVETDLGQISYNLERKDVKNINLRIRADLTVYVSAAKSVPVKKIDELVFNRANYIFKALAGFEKSAEHKNATKQFVDGESVEFLGHNLRLKIVQDMNRHVECDGSFVTLFVKDSKNYLEKCNLLNRWLRAEFKKLIEEICIAYYPKFKKYGVEYPKIQFRAMISRWGSCQKKSNSLTFNTALVAAPRSSIEYVVMHEFTHLLHPNHSKKFYQQLSAFMPDWEERKKRLEEGR